MKRAVDKFACTRGPIENRRRARVRRRLKAEDENEDDDEALMS